VLHAFVFVSPKSSKKPPIGLPIPLKGVRLSVASDDNGSRNSEKRVYVGGRRQT